VWSSSAEGRCPLMTCSRMLAFVIFSCLSAWGFSVSRSRSALAAETCRTHGEDLRHAGRLRECSDSSWLRPGDEMFRDRRCPRSDWCDATLLDAKHGELASRFRESRVNMEAKAA
jgi:hypothetical protein